MKKFAIAFLALALLGCETYEVEPSPYTSVVAIGVEDGYAGKCPAAAKDAIRMCSLLSQYTKNVVCLTGSRATCDNVRDALELAVQNELAIIYYSGHGGQDSSGDSSEVDGKDEFLCLHDGAMYDNEIWDIISCSNGRVMLIFDCCHSETMFRTPFFQAKESSMLAASPNGFRMLCWSGCPDDKYSYGTDDSGLLTKALLDNYDPRLTYSELWDKIRYDSGLRRYQEAKKTNLSFDEDEKAFK